MPPPTSNAFDTLLAEYDSSLVDLYHHPDADAITNELLAAAAKETWCTGPFAPRGPIVLRYPNHPFSLYLLASIINALDSTATNTDTHAFLSSVIESAPESSAAQKATFAELTQIEKRDIEEYYRACDERIRDGANTAKVALYHRLSHNKEHGREDLAALDAIAFAHRFPDAVAAMGAYDMLSGTLESAGLLLEAQLVRFSEQYDVEGTMARLLRQIDLDEALVDAAKASNAVAALREKYRDGAIRESDTESATMSELDSRAIRQVAVFLKHLNDVDSAPALKALNGYVDIVNEMIGYEGTSLDYLDYYVPVNRIASERMDQFRLYDEADARDRRVRNAISTSLYGAMLGTEFETAWKVYELRPESTPAEYFALTQDYTLRLNAIPDHATMIAAYEHFYERFPGTNEALECILALSQLYLDLDNPRSAIQVLQDAIADSPEHAKTETARLRLATLLYQEEMHNDAYLLLLEYIDRYADSPNRPVAEFLLGLSEQALGLPEASIERMSNLISDYPASQAAPRALFWIGSTKLANQEYTSALDYFDDLLLRYPDSEYAEKAQDYVDKLSDPSFNQRDAN